MGQHPVQQRYLNILICNIRPGKPRRDRRGRSRIMHQLNSHLLIQRVRKLHDRAHRLSVRIRPDTQPLWGNTPLRR